MYATVDALLIVVVSEPLDPVVKSVDSVAVTLMLEPNHPASIPALQVVEILKPASLLNELLIVVVLPTEVVFVY